jgi:dienelactone hydrolase
MGISVRCAAAALLLTSVVGFHISSPAQMNDALAPLITEKRITHPVPGATSEHGALNGVPYRIEIPANWNHSALVFFHGYSYVPFGPELDKPLTSQEMPEYERGYAVIQSAYSRTGWALEQAIPETDRLREYFIAQYGKPKQMFVSGGSMGGALTMVSIEQRPEVYDGALALCGRLGPTDPPMQERFAFRAAFDFYFPNVLPALVPVPDGYADSNENRAKVAAALKSDPVKARKVRLLMHLHNDEDVAHMISYIGFVIGDYQRKAGGNPFDNRDLIYNGTDPDDRASDDDLNDHVRRYAADPVAHQWLVRNYTPTGRVMKPMLALATTYDPLIPARTLTTYPQVISAAGFSSNFVQQYVHRDGHCTMNAMEVGKAFDELVDWVNKGKAPSAGLQK